MKSDLKDDEVKHKLKLLKRANEAIFNQEVSELSFEQLYRLGYSLVINGYGQKLYDQFVQHLEKHLRLLNDKISATSAETFLMVVSETWSHYQAALKAIAEILMYLDTRYCKEISLFPKGIQLFRLNVLESSKTKRRLFEELSSKIDRIRERDGECPISETQFIKKLMLMLLHCDPSPKSTKHKKQGLDFDDCRYKAELQEWLGLFFKRDFEPVFLKATQEFYEKESNTLITRLSNTELSVAQYIEKACSRFEQEENYSEEFAFLPSTKEALMGTIRSVWVSQHGEALISNEASGCKVMFDNKDVSNLKRLHQMFCEASDSRKLLQSVKDVMANCVMNSGNEILLKGIPQQQTRSSSSTAAAAIQSGPDMVEKLLKLHQKYCDIISEGFGNNSDFKETLKNAFCILISRDVRVARFLASYLDSLVKAQMKQQRPADSATATGNDQTHNFSKQLEGIIALLRWLQDKDVFEMENHELTGKRLISYGMNKGTSLECEQRIVEALKIECGNAYSNILNQMCKDITVSRDLHEEFSRNHQKCLIDFQVAVLTRGSWRIPNMEPLQYPTVLMDLRAEFEAFYKEKYRISDLQTTNFRKLSWSQVQVSGDLKATFDSGAKELNLVTTSMLVLLLFNEHSELTFKQIKNKLFQISELSEEAKASIDEIKNSLISLCMNPSVKILIRTSENQSKSVNDEDRFSVNNAFKSKMYRTIVPHVKSATIISSIREFGEQLSPAVLRQRKFQTEAAIVKIMKTRKELKHENLVKATMETIDRFRAENRLIKECIENLIERDFLCRSKTHRDIYQYVA